MRLTFDLPRSLLCGFNLFRSRRLFVAAEVTRLASPSLSRSLSLCSRVALWGTRHRSRFAPPRSVVPSPCCRIPSLHSHFHFPFHFPSRHSYTSTSATPVVPRRRSLGAVTPGCSVTNSAASWNWVESGNACVAVKASLSAVAPPQLSFSEIFVLVRSNNANCGSASGASPVVRERGPIRGSGASSVRCRSPQSPR